MKHNCYYVVIILSKTCIQLRKVYLKKLKKWLMFDVGLFPIDRNVCKTTNASDLKPVKIVLHFFQAVANAAYTLTTTSSLNTKLDTTNSDKKTVCTKVSLRM